MKKNLICIICPRGCSLETYIEGGTVTVTGNACPKGEQYAKDECINPVRTVTSIIRVANRNDTMVSVKTNAPIAKAKIFEAMQAIRSATVSAPIKIGDVLIENVCGANVIATKNIE